MTNKKRLPKILSYIRNVGRPSLFYRKEGIIYNFSWGSTSTMMSIKVEQLYTIFCPKSVALTWFWFQLIVNLRKHTKNIDSRRSEWKTGYLTSSNCFFHSLIQTICILTTTLQSQQHLDSAQIPVIKEI